MVELENLHAKSHARWMRLDEALGPDDDGDIRFTKEHIQAALTHIAGATVVSASINRSGQKEALMPDGAAPSVVAEGGVIVRDLPPFCEVLVDLRGSKHVARVTVWIPLAWNGRFIGVLGGGNRTGNGIAIPDFMRATSLPVAIRNGFAAAETDGGNRDPRPIEWGLDPETGDIDWELTENWVHRSTHEMTVIGKAVTEAVQGRAPQFSYAAGCSGGGRQGIVEARRYPEDYDGIWSSDPAINWTRFIPSEIWPALVMKESGTILPPEKLEAFRKAAIEALDGQDGLRDGIIGAFDGGEFDAHRAVGTQTADGPITAADANVMNRIWEGPRTRDGRFLWYGITPATESWGAVHPGAGLCLTGEVDGKLEPLPFFISEGFMRTWVARDPSWDWRSMSFADYERFFERCVNELSDLASDDPDLSAFHARGGKLILSHGACDPVIPAAGSIDYYRRVVNIIGSLAETRDFARLFISDGDGHGVALANGPGLTISDAMIALMKWVEKGEAPEQFVGKVIDFASQTVTMSRPIYAYPKKTVYSGSGEPGVASSYHAVEIDIPADEPA